MSVKTDARLSPGQRLSRGLRYTAVGPVDVTRGTVGLSVAGAQSAAAGLRQRIEKSRLAKELVQELEEAQGTIAAELAEARAVEARFLSHGDKKRLEIALTLALQPRILMFDEPTAGMAHADRLAIVDLVQRLRKDFGGPFLANDGFGVVTTEATAQALLDEDAADAVVIGRPFLANPDLVRRWQTGAELNEPNPDTFYGGGAEGYTDYPFLAS